MESNQGGRSDWQAAADGRGSLSEAKPLTSLRLRSPSPNAVPMYQNPGTALPVPALSSPTRAALVTSSTYLTLTSLESCFTRLITVLRVPVTTMVNRALSTVTPTARDSMLEPGACPRGNG